MNLEDLKYERKLEPVQIPYKEITTVLAFAGLASLLLYNLTPQPKTDQERDLIDRIQLIHKAKKENCIKKQQNTYQCGQLIVLTDFTQTLVIQNQDESTAFHWQINSDIIGIETKDHAHYLCPKAKKCFNMFDKTIHSVSIDTHPSSLFPNLNK